VFCRAFGPGWRRGPEKSKETCGFKLVVNIYAIPGDVDIASGLDAENEDHETSNLRDVLRRKL